VFDGDVEPVLLEDARFLGDIELRKGRIDTRGNGHLGERLGGRLSPLADRMAVTARSNLVNTRIGVSLIFDSIVRRSSRLR